MDVCFRVAPVPGFSVVDGRNITNHNTQKDANSNDKTAKESLLPIIYAIAQIGAFGV
jgi:hypothetical protein